MSFDVIGLSETWLQNNQNFQPVENYSFIHNARTDKSGGGVGLLLKDYLNFKPRTDLDINNHNIMESVFIELLKTNESNVIIGTIYRPPNADIDLFISKLNELLTKISKEQKTCYLLGDFNLDLLKYHEHAYTNDFLDTIFSHCFMPLINHPTRITSHTATLIDNILVNDPSIMQELTSGILFSDISDHLPIFTIHHSKPINSTKRDNIKLTRREINPRTKAMFQTQLNKCDWTDVYQSNDPNIAYDKFLDTYKSIYNSSFPLKNISNKRAKLINKPWISKGLLTSIKHKSDLYKKFLKNPSEINNKIYKQYKNKLSYLLKIAKKNYYDFKFEEANGNLRKTWKLLNEIINRKGKKNSKLPSIFTDGNKDISNPHEIANKFCNFFTNVGSNLANKLPPTNVSPNNFLTNRVLQTIFITPVSEKEIVEISTQFKPGKAAGHDQINMTHVKSNITAIAGPLSYLINLSISTGIVPDNIKLAKVLPIYKSESHTNFANYRPISILPAFSKFFEKVMFGRMVAFLDKHSVFYEHQYGFRQKYSTSMAMIQLVNQISTAIDNKETCAGIFLDLSKAFDTVNHAILISKLEHYGIRGIALDWIKNYLSNRKQYVQFNDICSNLNTINCGIPQGSILGPLLFILYINDISNSSQLLKFILFADDTNIFYSCRDLNNLGTTLNNELDNVNRWLIANKLSINIKKTKYVIFNTRQKKIDHHNLLIKINNKQIECQHSIKFLGIIIDRHLSWKTHIDTVASKISRTIGIISKSKYFISEASLFQLYQSLVYPYLYYGNIVWGSAYKSNLNRLKVLQKRIVRIITKSPFDAHTAPLFQKHHLLTLNNIHLLQVALFMYSIHSNSAPDTLQSMFSKNFENHHYATRKANDFKVHFARTNILKFSIVSFGPKLWNSLPNELKSKHSLPSFKNNLKKYLINSDHNI